MRAVLLSEPPAGAGGCGGAAQLASERLRDWSYELASKDNISVMVVVLDRPARDGQPPPPPR